MKPSAQRDNKRSEHVTIDGIPLLFRSAGVKNYLYHLIFNLRRIAPPGMLSVFPAIEGIGQLDHEHSALGRAATLARIAGMHFLNLRGNHVLDIVGGAPGVFHTCKLLNPPRSSRWTATVHDATGFTHTHLHSRGVAGFDRAFASRVLRRADGLIAVSHCTRRDIVEILHLNPERVQVIYHGIDQRYFDVTPSQISSAQERAGIRDSPYLLYVGTIEPRKNLPLLLRAYQRLPSSLRPEVRLVLAGPRGWENADFFAALAAPPAGIRYVGYVPEADLPGLMAGASAFLYPSLYEGFGFPVAQAMAAGVPVITSNVSSLPEITGEAAVLVDPFSEHELTTAMERVLTSSSLRGKLSECGRVRAREFSWEKCARETWQFFQTVAGRV